MSSTNDWRITAATIYKKPTDSRILGSAEIDVTPLDEYIKAQRKLGVKLTPTLVIALCTARIIKEHVPEFGTYIRRGSVVPHRQIDAMVSVLQKDGQMGAAKLPNAPSLTLSEAIPLLRSDVQATRQQQTKQAGKNLLGKIPWPLRQWVYGIIRYLTIDWGLNIGGISANNYGSFIVSNIGTLGLDMGYPALLPTANISFVMIVGSMKQKPWVVDGQIVPRTILSLGAAIDHRMVDASHAAKLFHYLKIHLNNPAWLEKLPT